MTALRVGARLRSQVCPTEVIIVHPGEKTSEVTCGGLPMLDLAAGAAEKQEPLAGLDTGNELGKRYTSDEDVKLEVLVTKPGKGTLGDGSAPLVLRATKPLPASD